MTKKITEDILLSDWTLMEEDIVLVTTCRGSNKIHCAIELCLLRKTGRFLQRSNQVTKKILEYICNQLEIKSITILPSKPRSETKSDYQYKVKQHLGFSDFTNSEETLLREWTCKLLHDEFISTDDFRKRAQEFFFTNKIVLPPARKLGRIIGSIAKQNEQALYVELTEQISTELQSAFDDLVKGWQKRADSLFALLKQFPPDPKPKNIIEYIERLEQLESMGIFDLKFPGISQNVITGLAKLAQHYDARELRRMPSDSKRYALLSCFLSEVARKLLDDIIDMNEKLLVSKERISRNSFKKNGVKIHQKSKLGLKTLAQIVRAQRNHSSPKKITLDGFYSNYNLKTVDGALGDCENLVDFEEHGFLRSLQSRYQNLRIYTPKFFELKFIAATGSKQLLKAVDIVRKLNNDDVSAIPDNAPIGFIKKSWRPLLKKEDGTMDRSIWELALYYAMKDALKSGDVYVKESQRHQYFWDMVYGDEAWNKERFSAYKMLELPKKFKVMLKTLTKEYKQSIKLARHNIGPDDFASVSPDGELKLHKEDALEIPESTHALRKLLVERLPVVRIEEILRDVEALCGFSEEFPPLDGYHKKKDLDKAALDAAITAHATNMGIPVMSKSAKGISINRLRHISHWRIREQTLHRGSARIINKHQTYPITHLYGDGTVSSSDAQNFGIEKSSILASFYPRYCGYYKKALAFYTHTADQYSVFKTQVISCLVREAPYVLAGLLANEAAINPQFHSSDTKGFTEHLFALSYLLGFSFRPRIKDIAEQHLYKLDPDADYGELEPLFKGTIDIELIIEQWDQIVKVVASLKNKVAFVPLILQRLANRTPSDKVAKALTELGRLIKTTYILRYISDPELRRAVHRQLNRGEARHALARRIFFVNNGVLRTGDQEEIMNKASSLSFVSNAILLWNTAQMQRIVEELRDEGYPVDDEDLARISPLQFENVIIHGTYHFVG